MPSNNSLADKVARNPFRFGMIAGFLGVPLLWMAGDSLLRVVIGQGPLPIESFWSYETSGALAGAFLGGQGVRIWAKWRSDIAQARSIALLTGGIGVSLCIGYAALMAGTHPFFWWKFANNILSLIFQRHLPFLMCILLVLVGLFGPRSR